MEQYDYRNLRKHAQISCFMCLINKALVQQAIGENTQITVTSFFAETERYASWILMNSMLTLSNFKNFASQIRTAALLAR